MTANFDRFTLRPLSSEEGLLFRTLRLRALADSPTAFGTTLEAQQARAEREWIERAQIVANDPTQQILLAFFEDEPCAMAHSYIDSKDAELAHVGAMWVDPARRGYGLAQMILQQSTAWAEAKGATRIELWVTEGNTAAIRLYERAGYVDTGARRPLPSHPTLLILEMRRTLR
ncbi:MAG: GNAT family N-acetyltransferase [Ardenticatenales bacterium]|nr:GNAT family N-acetyltransferase [Ardenticatenales bacterium]